MALRPEEVQFFRQVGYLKLPNRLPEETLGRLKEAIWHDIRAAVEPVVRDREGRIVRLSQVIDRAPIFREVVTSPLVLDPLESLLGPNIELILNAHNHVTLRLASTYREDGFHRDARQWSRTIFTVLFYLEDSTVETGCTMVVPGSNNFPGFPEKLYDVEWSRNLLAQAIPVPMPAGGMLVIDSLLFHAVGQNTTDKSRMSMTMGFHSVDDLAGMENPRRLLVRGERPYFGNDRQSAKSQG